VTGQREFTNRNAARGMDVGGIRIADVPPRLREQRVDLFSR
jgi:hypothetical protein